MELLRGSQECPVCWEPLPEDVPVSQCNRCRYCFHVECSRECRSVCPMCRYAAPPLDVQRGAAMTIQSCVREHLFQKKMIEREGKSTAASF